MTASTLAKTQGGTLLAWTDIANAAQSIGSAVDVSSKFACGLWVWLARLTGTAFTTGYPVVRVEVSAKSTGNDAWITVVSFVPAVGASIVNTTLNGAVSAGATTCVVTSATNIAYGDLLFLGHTTTPANYEIVRVKSVSGTTITFEEACTNAHDNTALVTDQAEEFFAQLDLSGIGRIRVVADNVNSGQGIKVQALIVTADSIG